MGNEKIIRILRDDIAKLALQATKATINKAIARGINYSLGKTRTKMKRAIMEEYKLPASAVVTSGDNGALTISKAKSTRLYGSVAGNSLPESLGHFRPVQYKDNKGGNKRGGAGGGFSRIQRRGKQYTTTKIETRNTRKSGVYVEIVRGRKMCIPSAFIILKGTSGIVMARGEYQHTGKTGDFKFDKPRLPINKLNTKSVYWGVMHPQTVNKWEPTAQQDMMNETVRQLKLLMTVP